MIESRAVSIRGGPLTQLRGLNPCIDEVKRYWTELHLHLRHCAVPGAVQRLISLDCGCSGWSPERCVIFGRLALEMNPCCGSKTAKSTIYSRWFELSEINDNLEQRGNF